MSNSEGSGSGLEEVGAGLLAGGLGDFHEALPGQDFRTDLEKSQIWEGLENVPTRFFTSKT